MLRNENSANKIVVPACVCCHSGCVLCNLPTIAIGDGGLLIARSTDRENPDRSKSTPPYATHYDEFMILMCIFRSGSVNKPIVDGMKRWSSMKSTPSRSPMAGMLRSLWKAARKELRFIYSNVEDSKVTSSRLANVRHRSLP